MIPKNIYILHDELKYTMDVSNKWYEFNPEYKVTLCDIDMCAQMIKKHNMMYYEVFRHIQCPRVQADFLKLVLLYCRGGVVIHETLEPLQPLQKFLERDLVICKAMEEDRQNIYNVKFMAASAGNGLIKQWLYKYINFFLHKQYYVEYGDWKLKKILNKTLGVPIKKDLFYEKDGHVYQLIKQQSATFFYDACFHYKKKRVMNDKQPYFVKNKGD